MRPSWRSAIFRWRSFSLRGPSMISTPRAANTGRGLPAPNGASDDTPAVPAVAGDHQHRAGADLRVRLNDLARDREDLRLFFLTADVFAIELLGELPDLLGHRLVGGEQQARRDIGAAHPARRVDARREHEADVVAVDRLAGQS